MGGRIDAGTVEEINELLHDALKAFGRTSGSGIVKVINDYDLTLTQIIIIGLLAQGPQTVSSLSDALQLTRGAVSRLIERMVRKGFVSRKEGDGDRRQKTLTLTRAGERTGDRVERARIGGFTEALSELDSDLAAELKDVMKRVVAVLRSRAATGEGSSS